MRQVDGPDRSSSDGREIGHAGHEMPAVPAKPYSVIVTPAVAFVSNAPTKLQLELRDPDGKRVTQLDVAHEKLLHLIVVSADLAFFTHEHPTRRDDGLLDHTLTLPHAGDYTVFADFTTGGKNAVASTQITVAGTPPPAEALAPIALPAKVQSGAFTVELRPNVVLVAGQNTLLDFDITDAAGPVTDLRDYLGAKGHGVIISADRAQYLHSHPMAGATGSIVRFHTVFPSAGVYKVWGEFRPRGDAVRVSFTVTVAPGEGHASPMDMDHAH